MSPLSFAQRRTWLSQQLDPTSPVYSVFRTWRIVGALDVDVLKQALRTIVRRHRVLSAVIEVVDGLPRQRILETFSLDLPIVDLRGSSSEDVESVCKEHIRRDVETPFDLPQGPLFRAKLWRLDDGDHVLLLSGHHIVTDGWSFGVLYKEIGALYEAFAAGKPSPLPALPGQYWDYAVEQGEGLEGGGQSALLEYWKEQLADLTPLQLPTDRSGAARSDFRGSRESFSLGPALTSALKRLSREAGVTLFATLLAFFKVLLSRYSGQSDVAVGVFRHGRARPELEPLIGMFVNTLVLRSDLSGDPEVRELLQRVRQTRESAFAHEELPFDRLIDKLQPERTLGGNLLFQVAVNYQNTTPQVLRLPDLELSPFAYADQGAFQTGNDTAKFDLELCLYRSEDNVQGMVEYRPDLFEREAVRTLLRHYETLLTGAVADPDQPVSKISLFRPEDLDRLRSPMDLVHPSVPCPDFPESALRQAITTRFEAQALEWSDRTAIHTAKYQWTYSELNRRANQIAHTLLSRTLPADARVALLCGHDAPMLAAILGVLKAGYTYVPLDPYFPPARLESIVADAGAPVILLESDYLPLARQLGLPPSQLVAVDEAFTQSNTENPALTVAPDALAYILYTSGTTGAPKGVMQSHRNVLHHCRVYTNNLRLRSDDRLSLLAPYGFDAAVMDIYGALLNGATLYPLDLRTTDPAIIPEWMAEQEITIYHSTPTVYRYWVKTLGDGPGLPACRLVVLGGEAATRADFEAFRLNFGPDCLFINGLGPTESTVTLQFVADHSTEIVGQTVPVGYPVENTELVLLDGDGRETDVFGEIAIRSPHVALGYWNRPELTAAAFGAPTEPGVARLYRTGDIGRRRYDGSLEFMGRKDRQVKIRGFRIEIREIESVLGQHPAIGDAVVVTGEDRRGDSHLIAYLVTAEDSAPSVAEIRGLLQQKLPEYMIPTAFVNLASLPRTPNGKVDHRALPAPELESAGPRTEYVPPSTPLEKALAGIWGDVLALERVGVHDNFFELGGHSLLATQVMSRVRDVLEIDLSLLRLFESPTIAGLAELLENTRYANQGHRPGRGTSSAEREEGAL